MSQLFASGGQSIGASASTSILPMNIQDLFPLGWTGRTFFFCNLKDSQESSSTPQFKSINSLVLRFFYSPTVTSIHDYWKNHSFHQMDFVGKVMSLLFMLPTLVKTFLPRSKCLLILWLYSLSALIFQPPKIKFATVSTVFPSICHEVMGPDATILLF